MSRLLARFLAPQLEAQRAFNADQVRLDNALLRHVEERFAAHPPPLRRGSWAAPGRRLDEVDERHAQLAQELVAHVHDLARRIDLVLARGRPRPRRRSSSRSQDLRARVARLEDALRPRDE